MAAKQKRYPWSGMHPVAQQRFFRRTIFGIAVVCFSVFVGLYLFTGALTQDIKAAKTEYANVVPLVKDVRALRALKGDLSHLSAEESVRMLLDDLDLVKFTTTFRPVLTKDGQDGVELNLDGLTLVRLTDFLRAMRDRASLQPTAFTLTRDRQDQRLADAHMILTR